jgi:proteasome lid subunit RPN8/RPN11
MTLRLSEGLLDDIRRHGEGAYPAECCGVLAGRIDESGVKEVARLAPAVNRRTDDPHRYLITPDDLRRLEAGLRLEGHEIVGYYHSHPDHPAAPSGFDTEHAWPWYSYLIVRVERGRGLDAASWILDDEQPLMRSELLEVLSEV